MVYFEYFNTINSNSFFNQYFFYNKMLIIIRILWWYHIFSSEALVKLKNLQTKIQDLKMFIMFNHFKWLLYSIF